MGVWVCVIIIIRKCLIVMTIQSQCPVGSTPNIEGASYWCRRHMGYVLHSEVPVLFPFEQPKIFNYYISQKRNKHKCKSRSDTAIAFLGVSPLQWVNLIRIYTVFIYYRNFRKT